MVQETGQGDRDLEHSPEAIRKQMAATRRRIGRKLRALKQRVLGAKGPSVQGVNPTMPAKKTATRRKSKGTSSGGGRKTRSGRKGGTGRAKSVARSTATKKKKSTRKKSGRRRTTSVTAKAKKVLGEVLTHAAAGAMTGAAAGAAEVVAPAVNEAAHTNGAGKEEEKSEG